jgi:hypothetical protein
MPFARGSSSSRLRLVRHRSGLFFFEPTIFFRSTNGGSLNLDPHTSWGEQKQRIYVPPLSDRRTLRRTDSRGQDWAKQPVLGVQPTLL